MDVSFLVRTDTATLCAFDEATLDHRRTDSADWWSDPREELREVNQGNALIVAMGTDGTFLINVSFEAPHKNDYPSVQARLRCVSGRVFVGAGEQVVGGDLGPDPAYEGGQFIDTAPDTLLITVGWGPGASCDHDACEEPQVMVTMTPVPGNATNDFDTPLELVGI